MNTDILQSARELNVPITIRRVPGGLLFWRSREGDQQQAREIADRLQPSRQRGKTAPQRPSRKRTTPRR
jgi:hypothetical protein